MSPTRRTGLGVLRRLRLRDVVLFSLPPFVFALYFLWACAGDYARLAQFDDWWSRTARVDHFAWWRVRSALRLPRAIQLDHRLSPEDTSRALLDLRVERDPFDKLAGDPIGRAGESVDAHVVEGNSQSKVELKLRGDTSVHWTGEKKTLALKSDRGEMFHDGRVNVFSCKEVLAQFAANSMAADFGLLAPPTAVVPVFLNQRFAGMYRTFQPLDETFLRNAGRIPGNIFRGDTAERGDYFKGLPRELFVNPYIWDRVAKNDRPGASGTVKLFELVARVNAVVDGELDRGPSDDPALLAILDHHLSRGKEPISRLFQIVDRDEIARLLALDLCVGDPWHSSGVHNHFWYEDSSSGILHPIPWDLRMLDLEHPPPGSQYNRFWKAALRDPRVFAKTLRVIHELSEDGQLLAKVTQRVEETWQRYRDGFEFDALRCGPIGTAPNSDVGSPEEVLGLLRKNLATLDGWCRDARASLAVSPAGLNEWIVDVLVDGRAPVELYGLERGAVRAPKLSADTYVDGAPFIGDRGFSLLGVDSEIAINPPAVLLPGVKPGKSLEREAIHYRFFLHSEGPPPPASAFLLRNSLIGTPVQAGQLAPGAALPVATSAHPWELGERMVRAVETGLSRDEHRTQTLEVQSGTKLTIAPGSHIVLDPDVSILCRGPVDARGTAEAPITFESSDPRRPWGSFALQGPGADGSVFRHVIFSGGGGALLDDVEFTGMVCVHWARNVRFEDCEFTGNLRCDDALHADMADVSVSHCWFHDTNADALDFDISTGTIDHCKVERAGNDGFDLMTCSPRIIANDIRDNADKGISVGENSSPFVFANTIRGCKRGIEVKDRSAPLILNDTLVDCGVGVLARLKNPRYERGGWPRIVRSEFHGNRKSVELENSARVTQLDNGFEPELSPKESLGEAGWLYGANDVAYVLASGAAVEWKSQTLFEAGPAERFKSDWNPPAGAWRKSGGVANLRVEDDCLVASMGRTAGRIERDVAIDVALPARTYRLVLEAAATQVAHAELRLAREGESLEAASVHVPLVLAEDLAHFEYTLVKLPPGRYTRLALDIEPKDSTARLELNGWSVGSELSEPADGEK